MNLEAQRKSVMKEIAKWNRLNRGFYEYKEGDILLFNDGTTEVLRDDREQIESVIQKSDSIVGVYLDDAFIDIRKAEDVLGLSDINQVTGKRNSYIAEMHIQMDPVLEEKEQQRYKKKRAEESIAHAMKKITEGRKRNE